MKRARRAPVNREAALAWKLHALDGNCAMCPPTEWGCRPIHGHHIIYQQTLLAYARRNGYSYEAVRFDTANLLRLCTHHHSSAHFRVRPVPQRVLKAHAPDVWDFADRLDLAWFIDRHYPKDT